MSEPLFIAYREPRPPAPAPAADPALVWRAPAHTPHSRPLVDAVADTGQWLPLGKLSEHLAAAGVLDNEAVPVAGAYVLLPYGSRIAERFAAEVVDAYERHGLARYEYASMVPLAAIERAGQVLDLDQRVFYVADREHLDQGRAQAALCPSGEEVIYEHWRRLVRTREDLPIEAYRRASYFRPAPRGRSGQGLFRTIEARDVFELHCCYADATQRRERLLDFLDMQRALCQRIGVPVLFTTRPPWGNHAVSLTTVAGDTPLPTGATLQVACVYEQGQRFSRAFDIRWRAHGTQQHTEHVTGAVSRRLLFAHLLLGMDEDGALFLHPRLAPDQVRVLVSPARSAPDAGADVAAADALVRCLREQGLRVRLDVLDASESPARRRRASWRQGVPIEILVLGRRHAADRLKVVLARADLRQEATLLVPAGSESPHGLTDGLPAARLAEHLVAALAPRIGPLLAAVARGYEARAHGFFSRQLTRASGRDARALLTRRRLVTCPMAATREVVQAVASWRCGEVLGYARAAAPAPCAISGATTDLVGFASPRI